MDDWSSQKKLAPDPVLSLVSVLNIVKECNRVYTFPTGVWPRGNLPVQCEISSLKLAIDLLPGTSKEEAHFLELIQLDETRCDAALANEAHKKQVKVQFDKNVKPCVFS